MISQETYNRKLAEYKVELQESTGLTSLQGDALSIIKEHLESAGTNTADLAEQRNTLNKAFRNGLISAEQFGAAMAAIDDEIVNVQNQSITATDAISSFAEQAGRNIQDALADFLFDPFSDGLDGMVKGFADAMRRITANLLAEQAIKLLLKSAGGAEGGILSSIFGGARADGGSVAGGKSYLAGGS